MVQTGRFANMEAEQSCSRQILLDISVYRVRDSISSLHMSISNFIFIQGIEGVYKRAQASRSPA
jgi:hypothetical protein